MQRSIKKNYLSESVEDIQRIFHIEDARFNHPLRATGFEVFRMMAAIGYCNQNEIFCFPWISERRFIGFTGPLHDALRVLESLHKVVVFPVEKSTDMVNDNVFGGGAGAGLIGLIGLWALSQSSQNTAVSSPRATSQEKEQEKDITLPKPRRDPVHHIVAKADPRAAESRRILNDVGIEPVSDSRNLVVLPQSYHASLHTTAYHNYVTERLRLVAGDKTGVEATLVSLKTEIIICSTVGIR